MYFLNFKTMVGQVVVLSVTVTRSFTRLTSAFVSTFVKMLRMQTLQEWLELKLGNDFVRSMRPNVQEYLLSYNQDGEFRF